MIQNMKPDRIQFGPPIDTGDLLWTEKVPCLTRSFDFGKVRDAALFLIYADDLANESDEIRVTQSLFGRTVTITAKPVSADYLPHAVYEYAAMIDAAVENLRRPHLEHDDLDYDDLDYDDLDYDDLDYDDLDYDDLDYDDLDYDDLDYDDLED